MLLLLQELAHVGFDHLEADVAVETLSTLVEDQRRAQDHENNVKERPDRETEAPGPRPGEE